MLPYTTDGLLLTEPRCGERPEKQRVAQKKARTRVRVFIGKSQLRQRDIAARRDGAESDACGYGSRGECPDRVDVIRFAYDRHGHCVILKVLREVRIERLCAVALLIFDRPLVLGAFQDAEIADDRPELAGVPRLHE